MADPLGEVRLRRDRERAKEVRRTVRTTADDTLDLLG